MGFNVQAIRYGWVALASLGVLTGTTIYVTNNQRHQVKPQDIIELALGTDERVMALQTGTNELGAPIYPVARPSFVRTWKDTNGASISVTNTIGGHTDRAMMISLDTTIKAIVPYYCDTNTIYDGTTNIAMLTVTGLWASLGIGDGTNKFTREPAWTNNPSTNWIVNYTSYWPSTNGMATNICYTSDYRQVVNYAQSWTATGGHVWVASSNWASEVVTVTNAATYGDYPWQIYVEDLQERYKVLNAMRMTISNLSFSVTNISKTAIGSDYPGGSWSVAKSAAETAWNTASITTNSGIGGDIRTAGYKDGQLIWWFCGAYINNSMSTFYFTVPVYGKIVNQIPGTVNVWLKGSPSTGLGIPVATNVFDDNGIGLRLNEFSKFEANEIGSNIFSFSVGNANLPLPAWCDDVLPGNKAYIRGCRISAVSNLPVTLDWPFNYCTNKFWE